MPKTTRNAKIAQIKRKNNNKISNDYNAQVVRFTPSVFGFPDRLVTKMRYCDVLSIGCTTGAVNTQKFRWNSTFDPDYTNTGHQPLYRDTFAGIYDHYSVISAKITVKVSNPNSAIPFVTGLLTDDDATSSTTFQTLMEQSHDYTDILTSLSGSHSLSTLTDTWDCQKILNIDPYSDSQYKTAYSANPAEESYCVIWAVPFDGISTASINLHVVLEQTVLWTELTTPVQS